MLKGSGAQVPNVIGQPISQAKNAIEGAGFHVSLAGTVAGPEPVGTVATTSPAPGTAVAEGGTITLYLSDGSQGGNGNPNGDGNPNGNGNGNGNRNGRGRGGGDGAEGLTFPVLPPG